VETKLTVNGGGSKASGRSMRLETSIAVPRNPMDFLAIRRDYVALTLQPSLLIVEGDAHAARCRTRIGAHIGVRIEKRIGTTHARLKLRH